MLKVDGLQGRNLPLGELVNAIRSVEFGRFRALRCCVLCECYWVIPNDAEDPGMQFTCPGCHMEERGPYQ